jgi:hypothetical protein
MPLLLRKVYADKDRQEAIIEGSGLDWVIVRPAVLNDKPRRGGVRALVDLGSFHGGTIARRCGRLRGRAGRIGHLCRQAALDRVVTAAGAWPVRLGHRKVQ